MEQDRNVNQDKERSEPLQSVDPAILEEAVDILSKRFLAPIQIKSVQFLSEPERRNVLLRITLEDSPNGVPTSVILKQALPQESSKEDKEALGRFARDWAGLGFLNALNSPIVPKVYGGSHTHRFILLADLGEVHLSLVDSLMGTDQEAALEALTRFAQTMGQLHADAYGHTDSYKKLLKSLDPQTNYWPDYLEDMVSKIKPLLEKLDIDYSDDLERDITQVMKTCKEPGPFTTLVHGDICPDNVFDDPPNNTMHLIDFEWGFVGNALLDGTYLRMSNPTCWCVKALPENVIEPLERLYRQALMKKIPAAAEDSLYHDAYVSACAYWMLWRVVGLEDILETDVDACDPKFPLHPQWRPEDTLRRPRNLARFEAFIKVSKKHGRLPYLTHMAEQILASLKSRWVDVKPLELYPAFVGGVEGKEMGSDTT
jgi:hypothetical protein